MTREIIQARMNIMQAYLDGQTIESRDIVDGVWSDDLDPDFDWDHCDYRVKSEPWRAKCDGKYFYISSDTDIYFDTEDHSKFDNDRYKIGNYFKTREEAKVVAEEFKQILTKHRNV